MSKVLFILKRKEDYNIERDGGSIGLSTGLYNSANYMNNLLIDLGIESNLVVVTDNNDIDREVTKYRPTHVIIEALWVVPEKFDILTKLHPSVTWIIRLHSDMPFLAGEGSAIKWLGEYVNKPNILIGINAPRLHRELAQYFKYIDISHPRKKLVFLPNYYPTDFITKSFGYKGRFIDIGCFGAIRPLKNQLSQAVAALEFSNLVRKKLRFHINSDRVEMSGQSVLTNLTNLFNHVTDQGHELVHHVWTPREEFLELCKTMDIGMQVSFSETFNIVGADLVSRGIPLVGSSEIPWLEVGQANPTNINSIVQTLLETYDKPQHNVRDNQDKLREYSQESAKLWYDYFK